MLDRYREHAAEREAQGIAPKPLDDAEVNSLVALLKDPPAGEEEFILDLFTNRVPAGVDNAAYVKAAFLSDIAKNNAVSPLINRKLAIELLGTMLGGYNIEPLIELLDDEEVADKAAEALSQTLLMFDFRLDIVEKAKTNKYAAKVLQSWANAEWFTKRPPLKDKITVTVFKVDGETNTDDLSPAGDAWSRPDIPLHAQSMLVKKMDDPLGTIRLLKKRAIHWHMWETLLELDHHVNQPQILYFGIWGMTSLPYLIKEMVVLFWEVKLHLYFSIPWKTPGHCQLNAMFQE